MSMIGKSLAHYSVTSEIGRGGMGEVYQAKDTKLGRDVAIKVLPEEFARDIDRVARFQREAKLLASLNHPNIAAIYGLEEAEGTNFLVLELIEGKTLAEHIKSGPIAIEEALKLSLQISEALEAAHEKGVIHRDLKPANIKITPEGKIKILDFGLAKAYAGDPADQNLSNSPTLSDAATQQGMILGTAAYMSPEQAKGKSVDKRADVWAFGVVVFEMLSGRQAFTGETVSDTLASVLAREPKWQNLPANLHPRVRFLLERCLKKDLKNRYSGIRDARVEIQEALADTDSMCVNPVADLEPQKKWMKVLTLISAVLFIAVIAGFIGWYFRAPEPRQFMRFGYELPEGRQFASIQYPSLAVSPDGKQFVYGTPEGLYLQFFNEQKARLIAGTEGAAGNPFFSPDGKWVAYFSIDDRKLKKISINGGAPTVLCDFMGMLFIGGDWSENNTVVFGQIPGSVMKVSANGGSPEAISRTSPQANTDPQFLPDGEYLMYTSRALPNQPKIIVQSLKSGDFIELFPGFDARYLPTGHIVYRLPDNNNLFAVSFDLDSLEVTGDAIPILPDILQYAVSETGTLICIPGTTASASDNRTLVWVDRNGKEEPIEEEANVYKYPKISPDGTQIALTVEKNGNVDIYVLDLIHKTLERLTFHDGPDAFPVWTPDSKRIIFRSDSEGPGVYSRAADGTGGAEQIVSETNSAYLPFCLSEDGKILVVQQVIGMTQIDIGTLSMEDDHNHTPLLHEDYAESHPQISPDGKWIAYCSAESDQPEIFVRPFPDVEAGKWQISTDGGNSPLWSPNGDELFYLIGTDIAEAVMRVAIETEPSFDRSEPEELFRGTFIGFFPGDFPWSIHPDGNKFLMLKPTVTTNAGPEAEIPNKIDIFVNWFEDLKQQVPID